MQSVKLDLTGSNNAISETGLESGGDQRAPGYGRSACCARSVTSSYTQLVFPNKKRRVLRLPVYCQYSDDIARLR